MSAVTNPKASCRSGEVGGYTACGVGGDRSSGATLVGRRPLPVPGRQRGVTGNAPERVNGVPESLNDGSAEKAVVPVEAG